jgi:hypothetical protein
MRGELACVPILAEDMRGKRRGRFLGSIRCIFAVVVMTNHAYPDGILGFKVRPLNFFTVSSVLSHPILYVQM